MSKSRPKKKTPPVKKVENKIQEIKPDEDMVYHFDFTSKEVELLTMGLGELPLKMSLPLVQKMGVEGKKQFEIFKKRIKNKR